MKQCTDEMSAKSPSWTVFISTDMWPSNELQFSSETEQEDSEPTFGKKKQQNTPFSAIPSKDVIFSLQFNSNGIIKVVITSKETKIFTPNITLLDKVNLCFLSLPESFTQKIGEL